VRARTAGDHEGSDTRIDHRRDVVPACLSSPITLIAAHTGATPDALDQLDPAVAADLLAELAKAPDPRARRGVRHRLVTVLAGARSYVAIAEWAHDLPVGVRVRLGLFLGQAAPSESTIRRVLRKVDPEALDRVLSTWLAGRAAAAAAVRISETTSGAARIAPGILLRAIAVDGTSARGARQGEDRAASARGVRLHQRHRAGSSRGGREDQPDHRVRAAAVPHRHHRRDHHHGCSAHPRRPHRLPAPTRRAPCVRRHGQPPACSNSWPGWPGGTSPPGISPATPDTAGSNRARSRWPPSPVGHRRDLVPHARLAIQIARRRRTSTSGRWHTETVSAITDLD
jgi:hypothetical protein